MKIGTREVGPGRPTFIIAEIGSNHAGSLDFALSLIDAAAEAGADAAKFQYFRVDRFLVPRPDPEALRRYELPDEWLPQLKARCTKRGIEFLCTAFDLESLDVVDPFVNAHKIGSWEAKPGDFLASAGGRGKPYLVSHGLHASFVHDSLKIDLRCVSAYPAPIDGYLRSVPTRCTTDGRNYHVDPWGVSDHTLDPLTVPCAAVALGACVVEKHLKAFVADPSPDESVAIDPADFKWMVDAIHRTERAVR